MTPFTIATIVEGHGEVASIPVLIRPCCPILSCARPIRVKRKGIIKPGELERYAGIASANIVEQGGRGAVLLVLDSDEDCPVTLASDLSPRLAAALPKRPAFCVIAHRATESWLVAGDSLAPNADDATRKPLEWLQRSRGVYSKAADQPSLAASFDLNLAQQSSRSFRRFVKVIDQIARLAAVNPL